MNQWERSYFNRSFSSFVLLIVSLNLSSSFKKISFSLSFYSSLFWSDAIELVPVFLALSMFYAYWIKARFSFLNDYKYSASSCVSLTFYSLFKLCNFLYFSWSSWYSCKLVLESKCFCLSWGRKVTNLLSFTSFFFNLLAISSLRLEFSSLTWMISSKRCWLLTRSSSDSWKFGPNISSLIWSSLSLRWRSSLRLRIGAEMLIGTYS